MNLTFQEFAERNHTTINTIEVLACRYSYKKIIYNRETYLLVQSGIHEANGKPKYMIKISDEGKKKKHLAAEERKNAYTELIQLLSQGISESEAINSIAKKYGVSYWSIYRMLKEPQRIERKRRADAGTTKKKIPPEVKDVTELVAEYRKVVNDAVNALLKLFDNPTKQTYEDAKRALIDANQPGLMVKNIVKRN